MFIFQFKKISLKYVCIYGFFVKLFKNFYDYEIFQYINFIQIIFDKYLANL